MGMVGHCFTGGVFIDVLNICGLGAKPPHMLWDSNFFRGFLFFLSFPHLCFGFYHSDGILFL